MVLSEAWPGERTIRIGRPQPSTRTCSLVVNPPRERPMARLAQGVRGALCEVAAVAPPDRLLDRARPPTRRRRKKGGEDHALIEPLLPGADGSRNGRPRLDDRKVLNGIFFILRTGSPWRDLPERYGPYTTAYNRFNRWAKRGRRAQSRSRRCCRRG